MNMIECLCLFLSLTVPRTAFADAAAGNAEGIFLTRIIVVSSGELQYNKLQCNKRGKSAGHMHG